MSTWELRPRFADDAEDYKQGVIYAARELLADIERRYPGEELRCPFMRALDQSLRTK